jgi:hypothetical protein
MQTTYRKLTSYRIPEKTKLYIIETDEDDFLIIFGTSYTFIKNGEIYDEILSFVKGKTSWRHTKTAIVWSRDKNESQWIKLGLKDDFPISAKRIYKDEKLVFLQE